MKNEKNGKNCYKSIPSMYDLLESPIIQEKYSRYALPILKKLLEEEIAQIREEIEKGEFSEVCDKKEMTRYIFSALEERLYTLEHAYTPVINATGIIIHTNIGRCPLTQQADKSGSYMNIEHDLHTGKRGDRNAPVRDILCLLTGAEDALVVNNAASALLLVANTFARGRKCLLSRGEALEIGDGFRLLDILESSGAYVKEVGSSNRTHLEDYEGALDTDTPLIIKANKSNYVLSGFTHEVSSRDLASLCRKKGKIFLEDLGSGNMIDFSSYGLTPVRRVQDALADGADLLCFSGDKMLGACQAGILIGRKDLIERLKKNPLFRALRVGKTVIYTLYQTLLLYTHTKKEDHLPLLSMLTQSKEVLLQKAEGLYHALEENPNLEVKIQPSKAFLGGGVSACFECPSFCLLIQHKDFSAHRLEEFLRTSPLPIVSYVKRDCLHLDVFCIFEQDMSALLTSLKNIP